MVRTPTSASQLPVFPNFFTITGPQSPSVLSNMPVSIEQHVEWITGCIDNMRKTGKTAIEAKPQAQDQWVAHVDEIVGETLMPRANSWYMGAKLPANRAPFCPIWGRKASAVTGGNATRSQPKATKVSNWRSRTARRGQ